MGIYVFTRQIVQKLLDNSLTDFGKHIIPSAIETHRDFSYVFQGVLGGHRNDSGIF